MRTHNARELAGAYVYLLPVLAFVLVFILAPVLGAFRASLFQDVTFLPRKFIGLDNYLRLAETPVFWTSLRFTCLFVLISVPLEIVLGLLVALVLDQPLPFRAALRASVLIPWAVPAAVSGRIWELIYDYNLGLANALLGWLHLGQGPVNWLGSGWGAFFSLVLADAWKTTPFVALILLAGLAAVPDELHRQGEVDGASFVQRFFRLTLPLLRPILVVALLFRTIDALRVFDLIFVLTGGGPGGATTSLSLYGANFFLAGDFGFGSAVSVVLFLLALGLALVYVRAGRFREGLG